MRIWSKDTSNIREGCIIRVGSAQGAVTKWFPSGVWFKDSETGKRVCARFNSGEIQVLVDVEPWRIVRVRPGDGLEEEFSLMEGAEVAGAFSRRLYADMAIAARILLEELAECEGVLVEDLVRGIIERNEKANK
ncbi:MAG: hypothetical protein PHC52_00675 [Syntrophales bacterium]|nr:hypothetical protein [Syntrophales bacterium]